MSRSRPWSAAMITRPFPFPLFVERATRDSRQSTTRQLNLIVWPTFADCSKERSRKERSCWNFLISIYDTTSSRDMCRNFPPVFRFVRMVVTKLGPAKWHKRSEEENQIRNACGTWLKRENKIWFVKLHGKSSGIINFLLYIKSLINFDYIKYNGIVWHRRNEARWN